MTETSDAALSPLEAEHATHLIVAASRFVRAASRHRGRERSAIVLRTLSNLSLSGPMRIGDLAQAEHITQPTMTGVVQRLEAEGLLRRTSDPSDGRAWLMAVTPAGIEVLDDFRDRAAARVRPALAHLDDEDRKALWAAADLLEKVTEELDEY